MNICHCIWYCLFLLLSLQLYVYMKLKAIYWCQSDIWGQYSCCAYGDLSVLYFDGHSCIVTLYAPTFNIIIFFHYNYLLVAVEHKFRTLRWTLIGVTLALFMLWGEIADYMIECLSEHLDRGGICGLKIEFSCHAVCNSFILSNGIAGMAGLKWLVVTTSKVFLYLLKLYPLRT